MDGKPYFVSVKYDREAFVAPDWREQLQSIEGVAIHGTTRKRARIVADDRAIELVRDLLGKNFNIEEERERSPG